MEVHYFVLQIILKGGGQMGNVTAIHDGGRVLGVEYIRPENFSIDQIYDLIGGKLSDVNIKGVPRLGEAKEKCDQVSIPWTTANHSGEAILSIEIHQNLPKRMCQALNNDLAKVA